MPLKPVIENAADVPPAFKSEYEERDGKFFLKLDGTVPGYVPESDLRTVNTKLEEFRNNNRSLNSLKTELETKLKSFDGIDPAEHSALKQRIGELEKQGLDKNTDITKVIQQAISPLQKRLEEMTAREQQAQERERQSAIALARKDLEQRLAGEAVKLGVDEKALPDFLHRGLQIFVMENGEPVAKKGEVPLFSKHRASDPLSVEEWAKEQMVEAPHLFRTSSGGGAKGGAGTGAAKKVISNDPMEFGRNLEEIAKGNVIVRN